MNTTTGDDDATPRIIIIYLVVETTITHADKRINIYIPRSMYEMKNDDEEEEG